MKYLDKSFIIGLNNKKFEEGWNNIWGKKNEDEIIKKELEEYKREADKRLNSLSEEERIELENAIKEADKLLKSIQ